ncbi:MAG: RNA polymerase sigma factor [bacterium]|nr:RNA polymerase sigma factor [bacterium]
MTQGTMSLTPTYGSRTDAELIVASITEASAFQELYERNAERILAYVYRRTFDAQLSADVMAETFAIAFEKRRRYTPTRTPGVAWLYGIARRELAAYRRRRSIEARAVSRLGVEIPALDSESIDRIERLIDVDQYRNALAAALANLKPTQRKAVELRVVDELDYRTVATQLGCSEGAARVRVHRALNRLADLLEEAT